MPAEITFHQADITSMEAIEAIAAKLKSIDILVNNAGIPQIGNLEKQVLQTFNASLMSM